MDKAFALSCQAFVSGKEEEAGHLDSLAKAPLRMSVYQGVILNS